MQTESDVQADEAARRHALVDHLKANGLLKTRRIEDAFRAVPRHLFLPEFPLERVYQDAAIPTKRHGNFPISSSSQPAMMAIMLDQLDLQPGHRVLEIGAGTGYNAAIMAHIVGEAGRVTTVDLDEDIAEKSREHLCAAGFERVDVICEDGLSGHPDNAPYDRIILTVGSWDIAPTWIEQLEPGGRIVLPLSLGGPQVSLALEREDNHLSSVSASNCGFMRMRGALAEPHTMLPLGPETGLFLEYNGNSLLAAELLVDGNKLYQWLSGDFEEHSCGFLVTLQEVLGGLGLWLGLQKPGRSLFIAQGEAVEKGIVPRIIGQDGEHAFRLSAGSVDAAGASMLAYAANSPPPLTLAEAAGEPSPPFELFIRSYGPGDSAARTLLQHVLAWDDAGRPTSNRMRVRAYPLDAQLQPKPEEHVISARWHNFIVDFQARK